MLSDLFKIATWWAFFCLIASAVVIYNALGMDLMTEQQALEAFPIVWLDMVKLGDGWVLVFDMLLSGSIFAFLA